MRRLRIVAMIAFSCLFAVSAGCGGGGARVKAKTTTTTVGQELLDLDKAYKQGVISEREYNRAKKKILARD